MFSLNKIIKIQTAMLLSGMALAVSAQTTHYVSDTYAKRQKGYDWVAVSTTPQADGSLKISVRSRADRKKPTCTLDTIAYPQGKSVYTATEMGNKINFQIKNKILTILSDDNNHLMYFCSGGASLAGTYGKLSASKLDSKQVDKTLFSKNLSLQQVQFHINAQPKGKTTSLEIATSGLAHDYREQFDITGQTVIDAEVEDLNADGAPELLVYTRQQTAPYATKVWAFSANKKQSLSQATFSESNYRRQDEFRVVENRLVQRFPIYNAQGKATGKTRQISYQLVNGEASRRFEKLNEITY